MKNLVQSLPFGALVVIAILFSLSGCGSPPRTASTGDRTAAGNQPDPAHTDAMADVPQGAFQSGAVEPPTATLVVYGMSCPLCSTNVDAQIGRIDGVESVRTNLADGVITVAVSLDNPPTRDELVRAVKDSGFTFIRFEDQ